MNGNEERKIADGIAMMSFKQEYRDAMSKALEEYREFIKDRIIPANDEIYSFAYWLFRYSGIVVPTFEAQSLESELARYKQEAEKIPLVCAKTMGEYCDEDGDCPEICPRLRGGERVL